MVAVSLISFISYCKDKVTGIKCELSEAGFEAMINAKLKEQVPKTRASVTNKYHIACTGFDRESS
jgi:hypothetical protein